MLFKINNQNHDTNRTFFQPPVHILLLIFKVTCTLCCLVKGETVTFSCLYLENNVVPPLGEG